MPNQYAPANPTLNGNTLSIDAYLGDPVRFARAVADYTKTNSIGGVLLKARVDATGSGSALIEALGSLFSDGGAAAIGQLSDYPLLTQSLGAPSIVATVKNGAATEFSDEMVARSRYDVFTKKTQTLVNDVEKLFDALCASAVGSAVTNTSAAIATWSTLATANPFVDIELADAKVREAGDALGLTFNPDIVVARPTIFAYLVAQLAKTGVVSDRDASVAAATGIVDVPATGKSYIRANSSFGSGTKVFVGDSTMLGGIVTENLGGDYAQVQRGETPDTLPVEVYIERISKRDGWHAQARKVAVPFVDQPTAGIWITGAGA